MTCSGGPGDRPCHQLSSCQPRCKMFLQAAVRVCSQEQQPCHQLRLSPSLSLIYPARQGILSTKNERAPSGIQPVSGVVAHGCLSRCGGHGLIRFLPIGRLVYM